MIGFGKREFPKVFFLCPFELCVCFGCGGAFALFTEEDVECDFEVGVGVLYVGEVLGGVDGDAEFFFYFACEGLFVSFAGFDFAAGEFPESAE